MWTKFLRLFAAISGIWLVSAQPLQIPKTWDDDALDSLELPLPNPSVKKRHVPADYYYSAPVRPIYKSYPVYAPGREPTGYIDFLEQQSPEIVWDEAGHAPALDGAADWVRAGELVFDAPVAYGLGNNLGFSVENLRDPRWYEATGMPVAADGTVPFTRYVVREKGKVEVGRLACGMCHTRVMADGTVIKGVQGNFPFGQWVAFNIARSPKSREKIRDDLLVLAGAPFLRPDPMAPLEGTDNARLAALFAALPPGVVARTGTSLLYPVKVPDLIGIKDRRYLDHTGLQQHRGVADLMRYAAINQGMDLFESFGGFIPLGGPSHDTLPAIGTAINGRSIQRYSDAQLYALAQYLYSLQPRPSPNKFDALAARGQKVFEREGCPMCHTPPLYTNNKLTLAEGFTPPSQGKYDILPISVGTDPGLTTKTRRGTGFYKVPSLRGVWLRSSLEHSGSVASLEDWFDSRRLRDDFVPTGFRGAGVQTRAVKGHPFGLGLSRDDKAALIAFLRTL